MVMYDATHKTKVGVGKDHAIVVSGLDTLGVHDGTTRGSQELDTTLPCPVDIVREGEKASDEQATPVNLAMCSSFSSLVKGSGACSNKLSQ